MKRVGIITSIYETSSGYSVTTVIENTIRMLIGNGYEPIVLVAKNFASDDKLWHPSNLDVRAVMDTAMTEQEVTDTITDNLGECSTIITHDIFLFDYLKRWQYGIMVHADVYPDVTWLHWIHSVPSTGNPPPPGYVVYPNHVDSGRVLRSFNLHTRENKLVTCSAAHSIDTVSALGYSDSARFVSEITGIIEADVSVVYPARMNVSKGHTKIVDLLAGVKRSGYEVCLVCCDWQSAGAEFQDSIHNILRHADSLGIGDRVFFTSTMREEWKNGVPRRLAMELMGLSNVYIHPSYVETYSITTHEAILHGLLVVANHDLPVAHEIFGDMAMYMDFGGGDVVRTYQPDDLTFWRDEAMRLVAALRSNKALWSRTEIRRKRSPKNTWRDLECLLHLPPLR